MWNLVCQLVQQNQLWECFQYKNEKNEKLSSQTWYLKTLRRSPNSHASLTIHHGSSDVDTPTKARAERLCICEALEKK